jgi:hypothetical protein
MPILIAPFLHKFPERKVTRGVLTPATQYTYIEHNAEKDDAILLSSY